MTQEITACKLSSADEKAWEKTRAALMWKCPAFSHILYTMLETRDSSYNAIFTTDVPIAATDGSSLILNPERFFKYSLNQRVFIVAHEIMHCIWNHCGQIQGFVQRGKVSYQDGTHLPFEKDLMNVAMDLVINDALIEGGVGEFPPEGCHDTSIATHKDSVLDAYRKIFKQNNGKGGGGNDAGGSPGSGFDQHLAPGTSQGKDPNQAMQDRNESEWSTAVAAAMNSAKVQGKLPASLDRMFGELLTPAVDWREKIQALFARKVGSGSYNWRRPDRRLIVRDIYAPGRSGFGAGTVVVAVDTSGSIGERELDMFFAEMSGILDDVRPRRLLVMWCDAKVRRIDECEDAMDLNHLRAKGVPGGGGTSFVPVFDKIAEMGLEPDALVYLTDGYGYFPKPSAYSVIWGNISAPGSVNYPFGDVVDVPQQAA